MWPFERKAATAIMRIGRRSLERWERVEGVLSLIASHPFDQETSPRASALMEGMDALCRTPFPGAVHLVLESAWMPVVLCDVGPNVLRPAQVQALVRHRFARQPSESLDPPAKWELRIDHDAGHSHALAYALSPHVKQAIVSDAASRGLRLGGITPAFAWCRSAAGTTADRMPLSWWLCAEQDRTLVARIEAQRVTGLHPGADRITGRTDAFVLAQTEAFRCGSEIEGATVTVVAWHAAGEDAAAPGQVRWCDMAGASMSLRQPLRMAQVTA